MKGWLKNTIRFYQVTRARKCPWWRKLLDYLWIPFRGFKQGGADEAVLKMVDEWNREETK